MSRWWWLVGHSGSSGGHGASVSRSRAPETAECGGYSGGGGGTKFSYLEQWINIRSLHYPPPPPVSPTPAHSDRPRLENFPFILGIQWRKQETRQYIGCGADPAGPRANLQPRYIYLSRCGMFDVWSKTFILKPCDHVEVWGLRFHLFSCDMLTSKLRGGLVAGGWGSLCLTSQNLSFLLRNF